MFRGFKSARQFMKSVNNMDNNGDGIRCMTGKGKQLAKRISSKVTRRRTSAHIREQ